MTQWDDERYAAEAAYRKLTELRSENLAELRGPWPAGQLPPRAYVIVDGLGTRSKLTPGIDFEPWFDVLRPRLRALDGGAAICGFSFLEPGAHFFPIDTFHGIRSFASNLATNYAPLPCLPTTYLAFSLGGIVTILGLASWLAQHPERNSIFPISVVLVQPAFILGSGMRQVAAARGDEALSPIRELSHLSPATGSLTGFTYADRALAALATLRNRVSVHLICWSGDEIIWFGSPSEDRPPLPALLEDVGVTKVREYTTLTFGSSHPFTQHRLVSSHSQILAEVDALLLRLLNEPDVPAGSTENASGSTQ